MMEHDLSPAVERARDAARRWADRRNDHQIRLGDWLLGLIEEDEGKPALLLARLGVDLGTVREALTARTAVEYPAVVSDSTLFARGRERARSLRGDSTLTSEVILLALLDADPAFTAHLARLGVHGPELESLLRPPPPPDEPAPETGPQFEVAEPAELADTGRILDANLNRAREALRTLDDYCRFTLNDRHLTAALKSLRHELAAVEQMLPARLLTAARDTPGDVGTRLTAGREYDRASPARVAAVNCKRLQEALRSLEEYGKILDPAFAQRVEQVRYESYTLERMMLAGLEARNRLAGVKLYLLLTGSQCRQALDWTIAEAAAGGVEAVQLREKNLSDHDLLARARDVRRWTRTAGVLFFMNDRPDIARLAGADGIHLGQEDLPVAAARRIVGPDALIGVSTHTPEQVNRAIRDGADYLGVGPTFRSRTKEFEAFPGLEFVAWTASETTLPTFALGGIDPTNIASVVAAGGRRVAVSSAVADSDDPQTVARRLRAALSEDRS